jgi:hypothetical protein
MPSVARAYGVAADPLFSSSNGFAHFHCFLRNHVINGFHLEGRRSAGKERSRGTSARYKVRIHLELRRDTY